MDLWGINEVLLLLNEHGDPSFLEKEKTNCGYKHNNKVSHGIFNLTFRMLQHTSSEVTVTKYDEI